MIRLEVAVETWPLAGRFTISRGSRTEAVVVEARVTDGTHTGRGECVPYARYGETVEGVRDLVAAQGPAVAAGATRADLLRLMPAGAARNALDCALWDYEAKATGRPAHAIAGLPPPCPATTAYTLSLGTPEEMEAAARAAAQRPLLKVKLGGEGDPARIAAVRRGAPAARLIVDANEAWRAGTLAENLAACAAAGVELIEQPLPASDDGALAGLPRSIPLCADESLHDTAGLDALLGRYDAINIKLDKAGGLTEALALARAARERGLTIMVGCMVGTSLAMAPAMLLADFAAFVDLDGPLLLARDREPGLRFEGSTIHPPEPALWG
ncbi:N-acetyl-D-Glu racemase DgcA [Methylobacterium nodulans]|uniref:Dipeptide epimerase n=1 Tax=Methylobacterium nodulans (strain LMG 21967 / CNCM I-2342 / ORS 2060) TaxID=460265 RepID=B8IBT9_METNO|nr:N-acetyl-D-Glu racemase DgcA [Methylobacterium nodulans]ACL59343.1 Mandelate racemase/muconate lactonizing protein [Methylobacterium nodulans ORS 2060]